MIDMTVNTIAHNSANTKQIDSAHDKLSFIFGENIIVPHYCGLDSKSYILINALEERLGVYKAQSALMGHSRIC